MTTHDLSYGEMRNPVSSRLTAVSVMCSCGWGLTHLVDGRPEEPGLVAGEAELVAAAEEHLTGTAPVFDVEAGRVVHVSPAEAMAGWIRFAGSLGEPSPAAAVGIRRALDFGRQHGLVP